MVQSMDNQFRAPRGPSLVPKNKHPEEKLARKATAGPAPKKGSPKQLSNDQKKPANSMKPPKKPRRLSLTKFKALWLRHPLKVRILILLGVGAFLIFGTHTALRVLTPPPPLPQPVKIVKKEKPPEPTTMKSPLTGIEVPNEQGTMPVTSVMIENSPDARPQSGLADAGVVFEAISEGGITRFVALYQESSPESIGPVRSVRPYYLDFLVPFDAPVAHAGGSAQALAEIRNQGIKDLDWAFNPSFYQRVSSRYAPHNLYTSRKQLLDLQESKGYTESKFTGYPRKEEKPLETPTTTKINFNLSGFLYNTSYTYDKASNSYLRSMAGKPHKDEKTGKHIAPKVLIAIETSYSKNGIYSVYGVTGSGTVHVFQDGGVTKGTWHKKNRKSMYEFKTADGKTLELNPGQTWITMTKAGDVSHGQ